jgi:hypothetical protein
MIHFRNSCPHVNNWKNYTAHEKFIHGECATAMHT